MCVCVRVRMHTRWTKSKEKKKKSKWSHAIYLCSYERVSGKTHKNVQSRQWKSGLLKTAENVSLSEIIIIAFASCCCQKWENGRGVCVLQPWSKTIITMATLRITTIMNERKQIAKHQKKIVSAKSFIKSIGTIFTCCSIVPGKTIQKFHPFRSIYFCSSLISVF